MKRKLPWVSVNDKLPEDGEEVLLNINRQTKNKSLSKLLKTEWFEVGSLLDDGPGYDNAKSWNVEDGNLPFEHVNFWMPIPPIE